MDLCISLFNWYRDGLDKPPGPSSCIDHYYSNVLVLVRVAEVQHAARLETVHVLVQLLRLVITQVP